jgi:hypothetical protein
MPDDTVTDRVLFYRWTRVTRRAQIEQAWERPAGRLGAARKRGEEWSHEETKTLENALLCWDNLGSHEAVDWDDEKLRQFKSQWEAWRAEAERKIAADENLTFEEQRCRAHSKGVWWAIGFREGERMNATRYKKFKRGQARVKEGVRTGTGGANIILERSTDLIHWTAAAPGAYTNQESHLFFRIRADRLP